MLVCVLRMSSSPLLILVAWSVQRQKNRKHLGTTIAWRHATALERWGREEATGVRPHPGGPASRPPSRGQFLGGPRPLPRRCSAQILRWSGPFLGTLVQNLHYAFSFAHFDHFPLVFKYLSCKTCFLQYKWNYINSKGICVKILFISPVLDNNWRSNVVVSDRQRIPQT